MPLPITRDQTHKVAKWMKGNFGARIKAAVSGTPFSPDIVCAIACQETAFVWVHFIDSLSVDEIIARCVFDASGDFPGTHRSAFPRNATHQHGDGPAHEYRHALRGHDGARRIQADAVRAFVGQFPGVPREEATARARHSTSAGGRA